MDQSRDTFARAQERLPDGDAPRVGVTLALLEAWLRGAAERGGPKPRDADIAKAIGASRATYGCFKTSAGDQRPPNTRQLARLCDVLGVPFGSIFDPSHDPRIYQNDGVRWRLAGPLGDARTQALRLCGHYMLAGEPPSKIHEVICRVRAAEHRERPRVADVQWMARSALALGLVTLCPLSRDNESGRAAGADGTEAADRVEELEELQDVKRGEQLAAALQQAVGKANAPRVVVVKNVAHDDFDRDPAAPFLTAHVAHRVARNFLLENPGLHQIGLGGGSHVATFVRSVGASSSPFPDSLGTGRRYELWPLTLEPQPDHRTGFAADLVAELQDRAGSLLGPELVGAPTQRALDGELVPASANLPPAGMLRLAVFGCGDPEDMGWLRHILESLTFGGTVATDVALNMLSPDGELVPTSDTRGRPIKFGLDLHEFQRMASSQSLALLLTSGRKKGRAIAAVARARAANMIVCDRHAADSTLAELEGPEAGA